MLFHILHLLYRTLIRHNIFLRNSQPSLEIGLDLLSDNIPHFFFFNNIITKNFNKVNLSKLSGLDKKIFLWYNIIIKEKM